MTPDSQEAPEIPAFPDHDCAEHLQPATLRKQMGTVTYHTPGVVCRVRGKHGRMANHRERRRAAASKRRQDRQAARKTRRATQRKAAA